MTHQKKPPRPSSARMLWRTIHARHNAGKGLWVLIGTLLLLSLLAGANFEGARKMYVAGQVAEHDVEADRDLLVEDTQATKARRKQVEMLQPPVYDLSMDAFATFQHRLLAVFQQLNTTTGEAPADSPVQHFKSDLPPAVADEVMPYLAQPEIQAVIINTLFPLIRDRMAEGLVGDVRASRVGRSGAIIRNLDNGTELLRPDIVALPDLPSFLAEISGKLQQTPGLSDSARRAISNLMISSLSASLTLNREATQKRAAAVVQNVEPVYYQLQKGEMLVRKGERVSREQQIKLQSLYETASDPVRWNVVAGAFLISLVLSIGFFVAPSGKPGTPLRCKDMMLISLVLILFALGAKGVYLLGLRLDSYNFMTIASIAYPISGGVGLVAMVFAARRYCSMGLLLCFFCMLMLQADISFFFYHFLSAMLATWIVTSAQNRPDVIWGLFPLAGGQMIIWLGAAALLQTPLWEIPAQLCAVGINSLLTLIVLFAVSPVLELIFGYSTRFRLMELMSLEQPLMQELMVTIPGTYHHSLVVANMVEAGAKAIGANSLLCKVAALYHDAGKLSYPEYFIENQFGGPNKHDRLAPSMSALIILSHVKKGTELAEHYNLGQDITDIIRQHHGTRVIRYFYQKALNLGEKARESDYSYPGPRPQSKEAAILMLADSVEASSRTLTAPTPARLRTHIDGIIKGIFSEGQLDESELTFRDLHYLSESFQRILTGIFHQRIAYPDAKLRGASGKNKG